MAPAVPQNPTPANVVSLLPKLNDADADLRYMSLNDLYNVLNAGSPAFLSNDYHTCAKTVECLLKTLDDSHGEVQNQAIKCLGALSLKLPTDILPPLVEKLTNLKTTHSVDSSISATALRTFIISYPRPLSGVTPSKATQDAYAAINKVLIPRLVGYVVIPHGLKNQPDPPPGMLEIDQEKGVDSDAIDVLIELIRCFGPMLQEPEKHALLKAIMGVFDNDRTSTVIKKKAVIAISVLAGYLSDRSLSTFVSNTIESFQGNDLPLAKRRLLITMVGSLARSIPQRLGPHLKVLAPYILQVLSEEEYDEAMAELAEAGAPNPELEEVREAALVALDGFLASCGNDMRLFTDEAIAAALRYVVYDPNNATDEDDEMGGTQGNDSDEDDTNELRDDANNEDEDFEEEGAMSDDDDASWKVRRCAVKALYSIISTRSNGDLLDNGVLYDKIAPVLINCFKEREENVRLEILTTLTALIRKTGEGISLPSLNGDRGVDVTASYASNSRKRRRENSNVGALDSLGTLTKPVGLASPAETPSPVSGPKADLGRLCPTIVRGLTRLLKQSSIPTKQGAITVLYHMVLVRHGGLSEYLGQIADPVIDAVRSSAAHPGFASASGGASATGGKLRIDALQLVSAICDTHSSRALDPYIGHIVPGVIAAVKDKYYKVSSEAIHVVESLISVLTPPRSAGTEQKYLSHLVSLYDVILGRIIATDADLEVRQRAIHALGVLLGRIAGLNNSKLISPAKKSNAFNVLQDRLKNETTRLSAVQAVGIVCASAREKEDLQPEWVRVVTLELGAQLRKADRILRGTSLAALKNLTANPVALAGLDDKTVYNLAGVLLPLVNANDLNLLSLALAIFTKLVQRSPKKVVDEGLKNALCAIVLNPLGGAVLDAFLGLVRVIGEHGVGQPLMYSLLKNVGVNGDLAVVGKAIGTLLVAGASTVGVKIDDFTLELRNSNDEKRQCLALSVLGESGLRLGSSSPSQLQPNVFTSHFHSKSDQVPRAAATALGRAGAGNINTYLPVILSSSDMSGSSQYLSLHSIKEILQYAGKARTDLSPYTKQIWEKLIIASQSEDNKAVGAECIGRLTIIEPKTFLVLLYRYLQDPDPTVRGMVIQAIRFTFSDSDDSFDEILKPMLIDMLTTMLNDTNLENRRLALGALISATHNKSHIILPHLAQLIPLVMKESKIKPELVREVQMGPFKHKVDDGLEVRKSAYETLYSLMEGAYTRVNPADLFDRVVAGLEDEHEIKVLCNLMLTKLIVLDPEESVQHLDAVADRFRVILAFKPKDNAVKQEVEKAHEASKGVLKVTVLLHNAFPSASSNATNVHGQAWKGYWESVVKEFRTQLSAMEQEIKNEAT